MEIVYRDLDTIKPNPKNPRKSKPKGVEQLAESIRSNPDYFEARPILLSDRTGELVIVGGERRSEAARLLGMKQVPTILLHGLTEAREDELMIIDNTHTGVWDEAMLDAWDKASLQGWGVELPEWNTEEQEVERKRKEFEERMRNGENMEDNEEYQQFLHKFEAKKTTDDCYTPSVVYDAVADYVSRRYNLNKAEFVRPFYPGGNYQNEYYPGGCVVVDNPPFSILAEILNFYKSHGVKFFLFAPTLTLFSSSSSSSCALPCGVAITYENGANVNTSFLTNLESKGIRLRSAPELYNAVRAANEENLKQLKKELPRYAYDHHIITSPFVGALSRLGIDFEVPVAESEAIDKMDSQRESGKAIYGKGYIVSDRVFAEREKAEREKAEREKAEREKAEREKAERENAERWELSKRELEIIERLNRNGQANEVQ